LDALKDFPSMESTFETEKGTASCVKIDVFKKEMWFSYQNGGMNWVKLSVDLAKDLIKRGSNGGKVPALEDLAKDLTEDVKRDFMDVIQENSLERFERKNQKRR